MTIQHAWRLATHSILNQQKTVFSLHTTRSFATSPVTSARKLGSIFNWNPFSKKEEKEQGSQEPSTESIEDPSKTSSTDAAEPTTLTQTKEWASIDAQEKVEEIKALSKSEIKDIIFSEVVKHHPKATEDIKQQAFSNLSLSDGKIKFQVITSVVAALKERCVVGKYELPNRNLNNTESVGDLISFYVLEKDQFDLKAGHGVDKFFSKLEANEPDTPAAPLPKNLSYVPYVSKKAATSLTDLESASTRTRRPEFQHIPKKKKTWMPKIKRDRKTPKHLQSRLVTQKQK